MSVNRLRTHSGPPVARLHNDRSAGGTGSSCRSAARSRPACSYTGLRYNYGAFSRSQATLLAYDIIDRMRANPMVYPPADTTPSTPPPHQALHRHAPAALPAALLPILH